MKQQYEITQADIYIGTLNAESKAQAVELAENEFYDYIFSLSVDGNPPLVATEIGPIEYFKVTKIGGKTFFTEARSIEGVKEFCHSIGDAWLKIEGY